MMDSEQDGDLPPSRSQRRRDALDVLRLAHDMLELDAPRLAKLELDSELLEHLEYTRRITQHVARKREVGFLAKQMRRFEEDLPRWRAQIDADVGATRRDAARLHRVEAWRDRLLSEGDEALSALLERFPDADRQQLRSLQRQAKIERERGKPPAAARVLFRMLRTLMADATVEGAEAETGTS